MIRTFDKHGLSFQYPANWKLEEETVEGGEQSIWLYSPSGAFWSVTVYPPEVEPAAAVEQALATMRGEYRDMDAEPVVDTMAEQSLIGYEMNFVCLDMVNTARVLSYADDRATYVLMDQAEDRDYEMLADVFAAITTSMMSAS